MDHGPKLFPDNKRGDAAKMTKILKLSFADSVGTHRECPILFCALRKRITIQSLLFPSIRKKCETLEFNFYLVSPLHWISPENRALLDIHVFICKSGQRVEWGVLGSAQRCMHGFWVLIVVRFAWWVRLTFWPCLSSGQPSCRTNMRKNKKCSSSCDGWSFRVPSSLKITCRRRCQT